MTAHYSISIIGIGRVGGALALALHDKKHIIESLSARRVETAEQIQSLITPPPKITPADDWTNLDSEVIFIAAQDSEIKNIADRLAEQIRYQPFVFHTSGSLSSEVLANLKAVGCRTGSIHPLVSISDVRIGAGKFAGAYFCVEGDQPAIAVAEEIVGSLGGNSFSICTEYKTLYHAAAVTACGHLVALIDAAIEMLAKCGVDKVNGRKILLPLIKSTVENLEAQTAAEALTGTFARADDGTLAKHLKILRENVPPETLAIYLHLGARSLDLAEVRGANKDRLAKMRGQILLAQTNLK